MMPKIIITQLAVLVFWNIVSAIGDFTSNDYKTALWITARFYGGQRSGIGPNWLIMEHTNPAYRTCFTKDADGSYDLEGGWFDCGDHVTFGQTFFYSAYMLAKAYQTFPTGYHDLYNGKNYSDYKQSGNWDITGGKPNGIPDILEELKYASDWIIKATPNSSTFYSQKGNGDYDHKQWVTAGKMSTLPTDQGGEPRPITKNSNDGSMPSFAAATLAIMSQVYKKYNPAYADSCLAHAKYGYSYAKAHKGQSVGAGGYYPAKPNPAADFVTAACEMYAATGETQYKQDAVDNLSNVKNHYYTLCYNNCDDLAAYAVGTILKNDTLLNLMKTWFVDKYKNAGTGEMGLSTLGDGWGFLRYPANQAFVAALYSKATGSTAYDQFIYDQIDYIMGSNNAKNSFVTGFCAGCEKSPHWPHHRNVYLNDNNDQKTLTAIPARNAKFGYMIGFTKAASSSFVEAIDNYQQTEGGLDYNAGLVGALGYIVSKINPADTSKMITNSEEKINASKILSLVSIKKNGYGITISSSGKNRIMEIRVCDISGKTFFRWTNPTAAVKWYTEKTARGVYIIKGVMDNKSVFNYPIIVQ